MKRYEMFPMGAMIVIYVGVGIFFWWIFNEYIFAEVEKEGVVKLVTSLWFWVLAGAGIGAWEKQKDDRK